MTKFNPAKLTIDELVEYFARNGVAQDKAILYDEHADFRRLYAEMDAIRQELDRRSADARLALLRLYNHENMQVRLQAARFTVAVAPIDAQNQIQAIADSRHAPQCFEAGMSLSRMNDEDYKPI